MNNEHHLNISVF